jgi:hypothetical protein
MARCACAIFLERMPKKSLIDELFERKDQAQLLTLIREGKHLADARDSLFHAMWLGWDDAAAELIDKGADLYVEAFGGTPIDFVLSRKKHDLLRKMIAAGFDVNRKGVSGAPLSKALEHKDYKGFQILSDAGARLQVDDVMITLLFEILQDRPESVEVICKTGVNVNVLGTVPLSILEYYLRKKYTPALGKKLNNVTPLMMAAYIGNPKVINLLLKAGARPELVTVEGFSAKDFLKEDVDESLKAILDFDSAKAEHAKPIMVKVEPKETQRAKAGDASTKQKPVARKSKSAKYTLPPVTDELRVRYGMENVRAKLRQDACTRTLPEGIELLNSKLGGRLDNQLDTLGGWRYTVDQRSFTSLQDFRAQLPKGMSAIGCGSWSESAPSQILVAVTEQELELIAAIGPNASNDDIEGSQIIAALTDLARAIPTQFDFASYEKIVGRFPSTLSDPTVVAQILYAICPGVCDYDEAAIPGLAEKLSQEKTFYLWWD